MKRKLKTYSDDELLRLYRESRQSSYLIELYERYMVLVYGLALKYFKNIPDAQDAVMQIWEELFDKVLKHEIRIFKNWLYTCARNYCLMELRRRSGTQTIILDEKIMDFCDDFNLYDDGAEEGQKEALRQCMENLPEQQRLCIGWFYGEEFSYRDIETKSGFSLKTVKSYIQNGKRNLRLCLERKGFGRKDDYERS